MAQSPPLQFAAILEPPQQIDVYFLCFVMLRDASKKARSKILCKTLHRILSSHEDSNGEKRKSDLFVVGWGPTSKFLELLFAQIAIVLINRHLLLIRGPSPLWPYDRLFSD